METSRFGCVSANPAGTVNPEAAGWDEPRPFWDRILRAAPSHLFVFDAALICRYAAPSGEGFLGRPREALIGQHATSILPPASNGLAPALERAVRDQARASVPRYRYRHRHDEGETVYVWAIVVEPVSEESLQGVLVALTDVPAAAAEPEIRPREAEQPGQTEAAARQDEVRRALPAAATLLRTLLTPALGCLQMVTRRPELLRQEAASKLLDSMVLPQLREIAQALNRLDELLEAEADIADFGVPPALTRWFRSRPHDLHRLD